MLDTPGIFTTGPRKARPGQPEALPHIVGIGGTPRIGSSSEAALRCALSSAEALGATTELFCGPLLDLPMYDPSSEHRSLSARRLVQSLRRADGIIISTPSYHGALSGVIKNALDYTEDMRADPRPYFEGRAVGVIVTAFGAQAIGTTLVGVRSIVHALRGWPTPFAAAFNSQSRPFEDGLPADADVAAQLELVARQVVQFAMIQAGMAGMVRPTPLKAAAG